jgi:Putative Flp pilus-assembly TadE/G-like
LGPQPHSRSREAVYGAEWMGRDDGQILPGLLVVLLALLAVGMMLFQVGKAAVLRSDAQTAADAAALAGATEIRRQLVAQWATTGTTDVTLISRPLVIAKMQEYAKENGATLIVSKVVIDGVDVKATVSTDEALGKGAEDVDSEGEKGFAKARARIEIAAGLGGASIGPVPGGGGGGTGPVPKISDKEWQKEVGDEIHEGAPTCADLITLGRFLQSKNFSVSENAYFGGITARHEPGGWHYKCNGAGALDVNFGGPGDLDPQEVAAVDPMIEPLRELGFRTIWRAAGHYNHLHVDIANSGPVGAGSGGNDGGFAGPLEDVLLTVRLIDYDAPSSPFFGLGGVGGGYFTGPPDPVAARAICTVAHRLGASDKVVLAAYEAAIVESGVHSLPYGDATSIGLFQQQDWWGTFAQRMDPVYASHEFLVRAIRQNRPWMSAGQLAQDVQVSAYPDRYDQRRIQALSLMSTYCAG